MNTPEPKRLIWMNDQAQQRGGAETYIRNTVQALRTRAPHWEHHLLYSPGHTDLDFLAHFDSAWVITDTQQAQRQLQRLQPDWVYIQQLPVNVDWEEFLCFCQHQQWKTLRFLHDHKLFCLREHKYTALRQSTCTRRTGMACYRCPGFIQRTQGQWQWKRLKHLQTLQAQHRAFDAIVVGSSYMADQAAQHGLPEARTHVLPLFCEDRPTLSSQHPLHSTHRLPGFQLLFVGQLLQGKGLDLLLHALARIKKNPHLPPFHLDIVGSGAQENALKQLAQRLRLNPEVSFAGWVQDKTPYWQKAQALVLPSRSPETFGLVGLEAMRQGIPVIASDVGGIRTWLRPQHNGDVFASGDVNALYQQLCNYLLHPVQAAHKGRQGQRDWQAHFQARHHIEALMALFEQLSQPSSSPSHSISLRSADHVSIYTH